MITKYGKIMLGEHFNITGESFCSDGKNEALMISFIITDPKVRKLLETHKNVRIIETEEGFEVWLLKNNMTNR